MNLRSYFSFIYTRKVKTFILVLIVLNAVFLGIETNKSLSPEIAYMLRAFDKIIIYIFLFELILKQIYSGIRFWKNGWNLFDVLIVGLSLIPATNSISVLRGFRILTVLRLFSSVKALRKLVIGLVKSLPSIIWLIMLIFVVFYLFAVLGTNLFGDKFPEFFGSLGKSFFSLFQIMTLESWSMGIARPVIAEYEYAYLYFVSYIMINTFIMLNLFVGIIVNAMGSESEAEEKKEQINSSNENRIDNHLSKLKKQIEEIRITFNLIESEYKGLKK